MSRIGKKPVSAPSGVTVNVTDTNVSVKGPKGELALPLTEEVSVKVEGTDIIVLPTDENDKRSRAMWGTIRARLFNMVEGVTKGYEKNLELVGVGYRAAVKGKDLELNLGFSHPVVHKAPEGITFKCAKPTEVKIEGVDKQVVGQIASEIRSYRPPEPYKGKGIRYEGEYIRRKEGKKK